MISEEPDQQPAFLFNIQSVEKVVDDNPTLKPYVIDGLLRRGEVCNVIAASKTGKSFLSLGMVFAIATGEEWLGHQTAQGRCLIVDNELHIETMANRIKSVANSLGVDLRGLGIDVLPLRGELHDLYAIGGLFDKVAGKYSLIVCDAFYRFLPPDTSENDNAAITRLFNQLDAYAKAANAAIVIIHHASKGNQSGKEITDVGAGAGSISRAADSHLVVRPHAEEGHYVLEAVTRSSRQPEPKTLFYDFPLWKTVDMEPMVRDSAAKTQRDRAARREADKNHNDRKDVDFLLSIIPQKGIGKTDLRTKSGWGAGKFDRVLGLAQTQWQVVEVKRYRKQGRSKPNFRVFRKFLTVDSYLEKQAPMNAWQP